MDINFVIASPFDPEHKMTVGIAGGRYYATLSQGRHALTIRISAEAMEDIAEATGLLADIPPEHTIEDELPFDFDIESEPHIDELEQEPRQVPTKPRRTTTLAEAGAGGPLTPRDGALQ